MGKYDAYEIVSWELTWYVIIFLLGTIGNTTVIFVGMNNKNVKRTNPFNVYVLTLACVDLLISLMAIPTYVLSTSLIVREILYFFVFWFIHVSMYLLVAISLERRKAVLHPFSTLKKRRFFKTMLVVAGTFIMGLFNEFPYVYGLIHKTGKYTKVTLHMVASACEIFIPMIIFIISFIQIQQCLNQREKDLGQFLQSHVHERQYRKSRTTKQMQARQATTSTMTLVILTFFLCTLPNEIFYVILQFAHATELKWGSPTYQVGILLRFTNCCLNPILYSIRSKEFRRHFKEVFKPPASCSIRLEQLRSTNFNYSNLSTTETSSSAGNRLL